MNLPNWFVSALGILIVGAMPPFLVLTNVNVIMTPAYVYYEYGKADFPASTRFASDPRAKFAVATVRYTRGELNDADLATLGVYNERELSHMQDVQMVATRALTANYALGAFLALALLLLWRAGRWTLARRSLFNGAVLTLGLFVAVGLFALVAFDTFFTLFHRLFFVEGSWLFPVTDSLIQFYPLPFWADASVTLMVLTTMEALLLAALTFGGLRRSVRQRV